MVIRIAIAVIKLAIAIAVAKLTIAMEKTSGFPDRSPRLANANHRGKLHQKSVGAEAKGNENSFDRGLKFIQNPIDVNELCYPT